MPATILRLFAALFAFAALTLALPAAAQERIGVLLLHGKSPGSTQTPHLRPVKAGLEQDGMLVRYPDMPWSRLRYLDGDWSQAMAEMQQHVAALRAQGAARIVLVGHSMGVPAALGYAARHGDVDALVLLAPGHVPRTYHSAPRMAVVRESVERARALVAEGKGDARESFSDINQGKRASITTTAKNYLSYFDPESEAEMGVTAPRVPARIPVLTVVGSDDPMAGRARQYFADSLPANPKTQYLEVRADHLSTPQVALPQVLPWIRSAVAP